MVLGLSLGACSSAPGPVSPALTSAGGLVGALGPHLKPVADPNGSKLARRLLRDRVTAWTDGSRSNWLAPLDGAGLQTEQGRVFDRMVDLGVMGLALESIVPGPSDAAVSTPANPATPATPDSGTGLSAITVLARFSYRLRGYDTADRTFEVKVNLRPEGAAGEPALITAWSPQGRPGLWDLPGLLVRRDPAALVVSAGPPSRVDDLLTRAHRAQAQVAAVWGSARPAVWVAPATDADAARLLGRDPADADALRSVSAVTDGPLLPNRPAGADRVVIVPGAWASLLGSGRQVVMAHELTHVVVRGTTTGPVPLWLSEGLAELVAYRQVTLAERVVVAPALEVAGADGLASSGTGLPPDAEFAPGAARYRAAYGWSLLAVRSIADAYGMVRLVRFYRAVAGTPAAVGVPASSPRRPPQALEAALASVLGTDRAALTREVRARARRLLS